MARVTVEDPVKKVGSYFELVLLAARRARQLQTGGKEPLLATNNDKCTVIALREIESGLIDREKLDAQDQQSSGALVGPSWRKSIF